MEQIVIMFNLLYFSLYGYFYPTIKRKKKKFKMKHIRQKC